MSKYSNADPKTESTFQRNDRVGISWRKRYIKENGGTFVQKDKGWSWRGNKVSEPKPTATIKRKRFKKDK